MVPLSSHHRGVGTPHPLTKRRRFRCKNPLVSIDSSVIDLCIDVFDWARFRRTKGAIELHLHLDRQGCLPSWALVTDGKTHDATPIQKRSVAPGTIVAMDRGRYDFTLFGRWTDEGVFFVTRTKDNMVYDVVESRDVPERGNGKRTNFVTVQGGGACTAHRGSSPASVQGAGAPGMPASRRTCGTPTAGNGLATGAEAPAYCQASHAGRRDNSAALQRRDIANTRDWFRPVGTEGNVHCRSMTNRNPVNGYEQGYNAQAVVTEDQYVVAPGVTTEANDQRQLHPMLNEAAANLEAAGVKKKIGVGLADAGYCSDRDLTAVEPDGPELLVNTTKDWKRRKALREKPPPRGRIPNGLTATERMERKLRTKRGAALYKKRAQTVEPVFGQIKDTRRLDRFCRRGESACDSEWSVICATHNLLKLFRSGKARWN